MFCTVCGCRREVEQVNTNYNDNIGNVKSKESGTKSASIVLGIISLVCSILAIFAPFGLIMSIIGLILAFCSLKHGSNLAGILLNSIALVLSLIISIVMILIFAFAIESAGYGDYDSYDDEYYDRYDDYYDNYLDDYKTSEDF